MATQKQEVELLIKAGTEGLKSIAQLVQELESLGEDSSEASAKLEGLASSLAELKSQQKLVTQFANLKSQTRDLAEAQASAKERATELGRALAQAESPTKAQRTEFQKAVSASKAADKAWLDNQQQLNKLRNTLNEAGISTQNLASEQQAIKRAVAGVDTEIGNLTSELTRMRDSAKSAGTGASEAASGAKKLSTEADKSSDSLDRAGASAGTFTAKMKAAAAGVLAFLGVSAGLEKVREGLVSILSTGDEFEKLDQQLVQIFGSIEEGEQASQWIQDFAANTPLQLEEVSQAFIRLKNFGLDPTNGTLQALVNQNEAMGGSFQDLEGIVNAVGQAWAKQKLQGEEILQLIERGVPVWDLLAKATGKNVVELQDMSSAGELGRETIAALVTEIGKASDGAAAQSMGRLSGLVSNLKDQWAQFFNLIAESGALDYAKGQLQLLLDKIKELKSNGTLEQWAKSIGGSIVSFGEAVKGAITTVADYKDQLILLGKAFVAIKIAGAIKSIGSWTAALRASRAEMMAASAQAAATSRGFSSLGRVMLGLAKPIPITLAIIGFEAAVSAMEIITDKIHGVQEAEQKLALQQKEMELQRLREINQLKQQAQVLEDFASVTINTGAEIARMSQEQRQTYADQLAGAQKYYEYAIKALERQAAMGQDVSAEMSATRSAFEQVTQALKTVADESTRAGEALRLGMTKEALDAVTAFTDLKAQGLATTGALQKSFDNLDLRTPEGITSMAQALASLVRTAQVSGQEIKDGLMKPLEELSAEGLSQLQRKFTETMSGAEADSRRTGQVMDSVLGQAFSNLGADLTKAQTGITATGKSAIDSFGVVVENIKLAGRSAKENAAIMEEAFSGAIQKVSTEEGLKQLKAQLEEAQLKGIDASGALAQVRDRLREIRQEQEGGGDISESVSDAGTAADESTVKIRNMADAIGDNSQQAEEFKEQWKAAWGGAFGKALTDAREKVTALSTAARNLFEMKTGGGQFVGEVESASEALDRARQRTDELASARRGLMSSSLAAWFADTALAAAEVEEKFWAQAVAMENLQHRIESGSYSLEQLNQLSTTAANKFDLLDDQRLAGLQSAIDSARNKLESLNDSADSTLSSLQQRLAEIRGDTEEAERLEYEAERQSLLEQLEEAKQAGADAAAADYQQALNTLEQIYKIEKQNRAEEAAAAAASEAAQQRELELANQAASSSSYQSSTASTQTVKTVNVNLGGETFQVLADDETAFLRALETARKTAQ